MRQSRFPSRLSPDSAARGTQGTVAPDPAPAGSTRLTCPEKHEINPEGERITGACETDVIGHDVEALIPRAREIVAQPQSDGSLEPLQRARLPYTNRKGEDLHLGLAGSILRDAESRPAAP